MILKRIIKICAKVILIILLINILSVKLSKKETIITANSILIDIQEDQELNVTKFEYGGIAYYFEGKENQFFENKDGKKADLKIKYNALIVAKVNLEKIEKGKRIDQEAKKIYFKSPEIEYIVNILSDQKDEKDKNFETIGNIKEKYTLAALRTACKTDAIHEINNNKDLKKNILKNAKTTIEGLVFPKIEGTEYEIIWEEGN